MDNPDLIVSVVVGDGEAETGPTATAWHGYKFIDPAESGAIFPIIHVNGFKISNRAIYGTMDDLEMAALFTGYGYKVRFVEDLANLDNDLAASLQWAVDEIRAIQKAARSGNPIIKPRWPLIVLRTPKDLSGPKHLRGQFIEGSFNSHGVPLLNANKDDEEFAPRPEINTIIPEDASLRMGQRKETYNGYQPLDVPDWKKYTVKKGTQDSCMERIGEFLHDVIEANPKTFRIWSPDELISNKLGAVLRERGRNMQWDPSPVSPTLASSKSCRTGLFPSYESFMGIIHTMMVQYAKFMKMAREVPWRNDVSSINYIETSTWARQEHNGFSHQNPSFIGAVLNLKSSIARVYLPPDSNCFLSTIAHCLRVKNYINLMVGLSLPEEAERHCIAGASVWKFASTDEGVNPDVVLVGIGVEMTMEVIAAVALLRKKVPELRVRVVNVTDLMILAPHSLHPHGLTEEAFNTLFTEDRSIHFNYHGYPLELKGLLFGRPSLDRVSIEGYNEEGTTTTPFHMMLCNRTSRFHVAAAAIKGGTVVNPKVAVVDHELVSGMLHEAESYKKYAFENGEDVEGV
ncbi:hypothetical protein M422DRAFT_55874 [Sphaerobolus stellatus SS14]|uniref:Phosphoketolase n=1 Tax=Sphaerobolus stellatus (strain SS14) TaxID=990650 RepID=A0A0C9TV05_SPHS4|nr:hypothetical protein M422DRAFT_55874 [Sphaerobolus stellatus SS14]